MRSVIHPNQQPTSMDLTRFGYETRQPSKCCRIELLRVVCSCMTWRIECWWWLCFILVNKQYSHSQHAYVLIVKTMWLFDFVKYYKFQTSGQVTKFGKKINKLSVYLQDPAVTHNNRPIRVVPSMEFRTWKVPSMEFRLEKCLARNLGQWENCWCYENNGRNRK